MPLATYYAANDKLDSAMLMLEKNKTVEDLITSADMERNIQANAGQRSYGWLKIAAKAIVQFIFMAVILGGAFFVMNRMIASKPEIPKRAIFPTVYTVDTIIAEAGTHQPILTLYGEVLAGRSVDLRSLVNGPVVMINDKLKAGGTVEKGDPLVEIDGFEFVGALREAKANETETKARIDENMARISMEQSRLASAKDQLELAKSDLARIKKLRARGAATEKQLEERQLILSQRAQAYDQSELNIIAENAKLAQQQASLERFAWKIEQSERNLKDTILRAPFSGTIRSNQVEIGKVVGANDVVVSMYQTDNLEARFVLTDERYGRLQSDSEGLVGRPLEVVWNVGGKDYVFKGSIDRIGAEIASASGGIEIYAKVKTNNVNIALRPGAFVEIRIPDHAFEYHLRIPDTAIYGGDTVYVVVDKKLQARQVDIAAYDDEDAIISSGIGAGDEILVTRLAEISNGLRVRKEGDPIIRQGRDKSKGAKDETKTGSGRQQSN